MCRKIPAKAARTKSIVNAGLSSGIVYGVAKEFTEHGYRVFGSVRKEDARSLEAHLKTNLTWLLFDVADCVAVLETTGQ